MFQNLACSQKVTNMLQLLGIYAENKNEVIVIRRISILAVVVLCLLGASVRAEAASYTSKAGAVTTSTGALNVRKEPSSGAPVLTTLQKGSYITLMEKKNSWWKVEYAAGRYGYCHADYITIVQGSPVTVNTRSGELNVRSGAGISYGKVGSLYKGQIVLFLKSSGGWSRVLYDGIKTGWVSAQYLSNYYSAIMLEIPDYKQSDGRWANVKIGSSGKTFDQIGCATTAIAMMESYRQNKQIYPDVMAKQLRYTPSGDVYWPEHYKTVSAFSLYTIYEKLKQGKPVLLGATNQYGAQHWVVVTGFHGGDRLQTSAFAIRDPGTKTRTNLQQFFDVYPTFYKYFYY